MRKFYYNENGDFTVSYNVEAPVVGGDQYVILPDSFNANTHRVDVATGAVVPNGAVIAPRPASRRP